MSLGVFIIALALFLQGCEKSGDVAETAAAAIEVLECELSNYPCTWNEVAPAVRERTRTIGQVAWQYGLQASQADVATFLAEQPGVVAAEVMGGGVIYRLEGGRPAWVFPEDELDHHAISPDDAINARADSDSLVDGLTQKLLRNDVAGDWPGEGPAAMNVGGLLGFSAAYAQSSDSGRGPNHEKPGSRKKALILSPFEYQWWKSGHFSGRNMANRVMQIRDYKSENEGQTVYHADYFALEDNPKGKAPDGGSYADGVKLDDFLNWDKQNLIVVASHGTKRKCVWSAPQKRGASGDDTQATGSEISCPLIWAGRVKQDYGGLVGVEVITWKRSVIAESPGLTRLEALECSALIDRYIDEWNTWREGTSPDSDNSATEPQSPKTESGKRCQYSKAEWPQLIGLLPSFFKKEYPDGLNHVILFLASCRSALNNVLIDLFAREGNENVAVMGFDGPVLAAEGFKVAYDMIDLMGKGRDNAEILEKLKKTNLNPTGVSDHDGELQGRTLDIDDSPVESVAPKLVDVSQNLTHGRDIVMLVDESGRELRDGGQVRVNIAAASDESDRLAIHPQIIGLDDQVAAQMTLDVGVVDESFPDERYPASKKVEPWVHRYDQDISLGRKYRENEVVDLEVRVDFPDGKESRWVYEEIRLTAERCSWSAEVSGETPAAGQFGASAGRVAFDDSLLSPIGIDAYPGEGEPDYPRPNPPWLVIRLQDLDFSRLRNPSVVSEIYFAIPGLEPGQTGKFERVWGTLIAGGMSYDGNADYLRRDVIGLPEGSGIGHLLTSTVTLTQNNDERVEGSFEARFLNPRVFAGLGPYEQHPLGVGIHPITGAEVRATGNFSLLRAGKCTTGMKWGR